MISTPNRSTTGHEGVDRIRTGEQGLSTTYTYARRGTTPRGRVGSERGD